VITVDVGLLKVVGEVVGIAGILLLIFFYLFRDFIRKSAVDAFKMGANQGYRLLRPIALLVWSIPVIGLALWAYGQHSAPSKPKTEAATGGAAPDSGAVAGAAGPVVGAVSSPDVGHNPKIFTPPRDVIISHGWTGRIFLDLAPKGLSEAFETHTSQEAGLVTAKSIGKWLAISGVVSDVTTVRAPTQQNEVMYSLVFIDHDPGSPLPYLLFDTAWSERLSLLDKGSNISAACRISEVESFEVRLDKCEFL
jgi:hypothetical protein